MKTAIEIFIVGIFMMTPGETKDDLENIVKEMRMEVNEIKSCLEATQAELVELKTKNMELKERLETAEDDLKLTATKDDLTTTNVQLDDLTSFMDDLISKDHELERDVSIIRNPPFIHSCGSLSPPRPSPTAACSTPPPTLRGVVWILLPECSPPHGLDHTPSLGVCWLMMMLLIVRCRST